MLDESPNKPPSDWASLAPSAWKSPIRSGPSTTSWTGLVSTLNVWLTLTSNAPMLWTRSLSSEPEWNVRAGDMGQYKVIGRDCDDESLTVLVAIEVPSTSSTTYG
jgi:hypothetical protein